MPDAKPRRDDRALYQPRSSAAFEETIQSPNHALEMTLRKKPEKPGFAVLMKGFLGTDPYQCILCKGRLRFAGAQAGTQAMA